MSAYEELVRRVAKAARKDKFERLRIGKVFDSSVEPTESELDDAKAAIAEVRRTLETPTEEMWDAWRDADDRMYNPYLAMLRASPLSP